MIKTGIIATEEYIGPHGLTCMDCAREVRPGDEVAERLSGMVDDIPLVEIICGACGAGGLEDPLMGICVRCGGMSEMDKPCHCGGEVAFDD